DCASADPVINVKTAAMAANAHAFVILVQPEDQLIVQLGFTFVKYGELAEYSMCQRRRAGESSGVVLTLSRFYFCCNTSRSSAMEASGTGWAWRSAWRVGTS